MPELRECIAHFLLLLHLLKYFHWRSYRPWALLEIWTDARVDQVAVVKKNGEEEGGAKSGDHPEWRRMRKGLPFRVTQDSSATVGPKPVSLWPPDIKDAKDLSARMRLEGVEYSPRDLYLNFGHRWFTFKYLLHSSVHMYKPAEWAVLREMPQSGRAYKFSIVFVFQTAVIAFQSFDANVQPGWELACPPPKPNICPWRSDDPYPENVPFLTHFAAFLRTVWEKPWKKGLAIEYIRKIGDDFPGVGAYSASEIFAYAGLPHDLTITELFNCPSRVGRLLEAGYTLAHSGWTEGFAVFLKRALRGGYLVAPTIEDRLYCASRYFLVWAKESTKVSDRMGALYEMAKNDFAGCQELEYDVFEPSLIGVAFKRKMHLGPLIFGRDFWRKNHADKYGMPAMDPVSEAFEKYKFACKDDHLHPDEYYSPGPPLVLSPARLQERKVETFTFRMGKKIAWSLTAPRYGLRRLTGDDREMRFAATIIQTKLQVSVGPLEYSGNALGFRKRGNGRRGVHVALCKGDPGMKQGKIDYWPLHLRGQARAKERIAISLMQKRISMVVKAERKKKGRAGLQKKIRDYHKVVDDVVVQFGRGRKVKSGNRDAKVVKKRAGRVKIVKTRRSVDKHLADVNATLPDGGHDFDSEGRRRSKRQRVSD
ncbi:hypothetical protein EXIGLDRAFT_781882 [Exidia glandulosa HHB12029]|uniref:Uncharacterized protein n=1 Tax=Exidia glandulosa HHB12029 TaxID=1314781 RepID=A0A165B3X8_EXIGL|nr:hypothetical protein EXIGLDRAFT_781882 [Exidia glandulosa HHB12029]